MTPKRTEDAILLPIRPEYVERIRMGTKRIEFRSKLWDTRSKVKRVYIYETHPICAVVGYFGIADILKGPPEEVYAKAGLFAGIDYEDYQKYSEGRDFMYGLVIKQPVFFKSPIPLVMIGKELKAPQHFRYCDKEMSDKIVTLATGINKFEPAQMTPEEAAVLKYISTKTDSIERKNVH